MLFKALLLLSLILQLPTEPGNGLPAQDESRRVNDKDNKFYIIPPERWKPVETPSNAILAYRDDKTQFASNFTVREVKPKDNAEPKLQEIAEAIKNRYLEVKYTIEDGPKDPEINKLSASYLFYRFERPRNNGKDNTTDQMYGMTYLILSPRNSVYIVTFTMRYDTRKEFEPLAVTSAKSIQLK